MMHAIHLAALCAVFGALASGCASTRTRAIEADGMWVDSKVGSMAIGSVDVMASAQGERSAMVRYDEDTAWLSPATKLHSIRVQLTGDHAARAPEIVRAICAAFVEVAGDSHAPSSDASSSADADAYAKGGE